VQGLRNGGKYLVELGYFKENPVDKVLDLRYQPA
jgi:NitT/TauT family transport system substrate-binding protein